MGIFKKDEMMLDFKGVQTEDISSTVPYMNKLNYDAKILVNSLGPQANAAMNRKGLVLFNENDQFDLYKLFEKSTTLNNNDNNFSETSPFISSDVYNQLLNKLKDKKQVGGGKSKDSKMSKSRDEDHDDDFDNESSTTSSEESESDKKKKKIKKMFKEESDEVDIEPEEEDEISEMSAGSYVSSSAHTDGSDDANSSDASESYTSSTVSLKNNRKHKGYNHNLSDSVNTSDINIISVDE